MLLRQLVINRIYRYFLYDLWYLTSGGQVDLSMLLHRGLWRQSSGAPGFRYARSGLHQRSAIDPV